MYDDKIYPRVSETSGVTNFYLSGQVESLKTPLMCLNDACNFSNRSNRYFNCTFAFFTLKVPLDTKRQNIT